ncbi:MAG: hypothetical protein LBT00_01990 [Spirochaetaceae bacterium]|jgi:hypothetical protein|nr:hypothetical protein [Spirochaetaceae bacterium]
MAQKQMMTLDEKLAVGMKAHEYLEAGNKAEAVRIILELPMLPYLAKAVKEFSGADFLIKGGYNLSEAEAEFGPGWLAQ